MARVLPRILWVALLAVAVASVGLAVSACLPDDAPASTPVSIPTLIPTSVPTPTPTLVSVSTLALGISESPAPTAAEIFRLSVEAMKSFDSFSYVLETVVPVDDFGLPVVSFPISGAFLAPDREWTRVTFRAGGLSMELEFISIGEDFYVRDPLTGAWSIQPREPDDVYDSAYLFLDLGFAGAVTLVGLADLDGRSVDHLRGSPVVDILGDYSGFVGVEVVQLGQVDFWIGSDDFLMRQAVLDISYVDGSGSPVSMKFFVSFHGYGGLVVIEASEIAHSEIAPDEGYPSLTG